MYSKNNSNEPVHKDRKHPVHRPLFNNSLSRCIPDVGKWGMLVYLVLKLVCKPISITAARLMCPDMHDILLLVLTKDTELSVSVDLTGIKQELNGPHLHYFLRSAVTIKVMTKTAG